MRLTKQKQILTKNQYSEGLVLRNMSKINKCLTKLIKRERRLNLLKLEMKREPIQQMPMEFRKINKGML